MSWSNFYKLKKPDFVSHNIYVFHFYVDYVRLFKRGRKLWFFDDKEFDIDGLDEMLEEEIEEEEEEEPFGEEEEVEIGESEGVEEEEEEKEEEDNENEDEEMKKIKAKEKWRKIMEKARKMDVTEFTKPEQLELIFISGITEREPDQDHIELSQRLKHIIQTMNKIQPTVASIKSNINRLQILEGKELIIDTDDEYEQFERSNLPYKYTSDKSLIDSYIGDVERAKYAEPELKVSLALYDIELIEIYEDRFAENIKKKFNKTTEIVEEEEIEQINIIENEIETKLMPPDCPVDLNDGSKILIDLEELETLYIYKAITSCTPENILDKIERIPLFIGLSTCKIDIITAKLLGMTKLTLGEPFIEAVIKAANSTNETPFTVNKETILPIINNNDMIIGKMKINIKLSCYGKPGWPECPKGSIFSNSYENLLAASPITLSTPSGSSVSDEDLTDIDFDDLFEN